TISAGFVLSILLALLISLPFANSRLKEVAAEEVEFSRAGLLREIIPFGLMVTILRMFTNVIWSVDKIILGFLLPPESAMETVAIYSMAVMVALVLIVFPQAISNIFLPVMSGLAGKKDLKEMRKVTETAQRWSVFISIPIALLMIAFSRDILIVLYGISYASGAFAFSIFTVGVLLRAVVTIPSNVLAALRKIELEIKVAAFVSVLNIALNFLLISHWGMEGAALASTFSLFVMLALVLHYVKGLIGYTLPPEVYKMFGAGIAAFLVILLFRPALSSAFELIPELGGGETGVYAGKVLYLAYLGILMAISTAIFSLFSLLMKCFRREDIILMKKVMKRAGFPESLVRFAESLASRGVPAHK
ncbi:oligosaccharide flippase family protein, partial [Candidatus Micrarchaeota archaeon]|nr:oligosaccharide flippase family protein [Candidatus Micrarchaeota archaeon]